MKKITITLLLALSLAAALSGCVVEPLGFGGHHHYHD